MTTAERWRSEAHEAFSAFDHVEAIRALLVVRRSGRNVRIKYLNQIRHLGFAAPDELRERLRDVHRDRLARTAASLRATAGSDTVVYATKLAIATLGRRVLALERSGRDRTPWTQVRECAGQRCCALPPTSGSLTYLRRSCSSRRYVHLVLARPLSRPDSAAWSAQCDE